MKDITSKEIAEWVNDYKEKRFPDGLPDDIGEIVGEILTDAYSVGYRDAKAMFAPKQPKPRIVLRGQKGWPGRMV